LIRNKNNRLVWIHLAKWGIVGGVLVFSFLKMETVINLFNNNTQLPIFTFETILWTGLAIMLLPFNIWLESIKWGYLLPPNVSHSFTQKIEAVLTGVSLGLITPNQIGDFAGKVIHVPKYLQKQSIGAAIVGGIAQWSVSIWFGSLALLFLVNQNLINLAQPIIWILVGCLTMIPLGFIHLPFFTKHLKTNWNNDYLELITKFERPELQKLWAISSLRYVVYTCQYILLLYAFNIDLSIILMLAIIAAIFIIQSIMPSFIIVQLGIRGLSAVWLFGLFQAPIAAVLFASYSLWLINQLIPAILGLFIIIKYNFSAS
jgi:hypothetical protein